MYYFVTGKTKMNADKYQQTFETLVTSLNHLDIDHLEKLSRWKMLLNLQDVDRARGIVEELKKILNEGKMSQS